MSAGDDFTIEREPPRRIVARARGVGGPYRETVDAGAIERRHVDRRRNVMRQHATKRSGERYGFDTARGQIEMLPKAFRRFLGRHHLEELLLPRRAAHGVDQRTFRLGEMAHGSGLMSISVPAG